MKPRFIVFEGMSGAGKSPILERLNQRLLEEGENVALTDEPTHGPWGEKIRELIHETVPGETPERFQMLYILDRKEDIEKNIAPAFAEGKTVISERYFLSTLAYGEAFGVGWKHLWNMHEEMLGKGFPKPNLTFLFDLDAMVAFERLKKQGGKLDYFETPERLRSIREAYLRIAKHFDSVVVIDATPSKEVVFEQVKKEYEMRLHA